MTDLSPGWEWATLDEVAIWGSGGTPKAGLAEYYGGEIPWAIIGDLNDGVVNVTQNSITQRGLQASSAKLVPPGAILLAMYGSIGKLGIAGRELATNQAIAHAIPYCEAMDERYLFWYLLSQRHELDRSGKGATQRNISQTILRSWPIPVPPLLEQCRIVTALEEYLSHLGAGASSFGYIKQQIVRMDTALRAKVLTLGDDSSEWKEVSIGEIAVSIRNGRFVSRPGSIPNGVAILRIGAVRSLELDLSDLRYSGLTSSSLRESDHLLDVGDILFTRYNGNPSYVGACAVVSPLDRDLAYPDKLIRVRVDTAVADPEFVALACSSGKSRAQIRSLVKTTAGQAGISARDLRVIRLGLPSLHDQRRIVTHYKNKSSDLMRLRNILVSLVQQSGKLHRSLLNDAFAGRLVPHDPNAESASTLLGRIRAERAAQPKARRARRTPRNLDEQGSLL